MITGAILRKGEEGYTYLKKIFDLTDNFQRIWAVFSGFEKMYSKDDVIEYKLPFADGYDGFWHDNFSIQHPLASVELVAWDSSCTLLISRNESIVNDFKKAFPLSEDLREYNTSTKV